MIHSFDSLRLAEAVDAAAGRMDRTVPVLLEVNFPAKRPSTALLPRRSNRFCRI